MFHLQALFWNTWEADVELTAFLSTFITLWLTAWVEHAVRQYISARGIKGHESKIRIRMAAREILPRRRGFLDNVRNSWTEFKAELQWMENPSPGDFMSFAVVMHLIQPLKVRAITRVRYRQAEIKLCTVWSPQDWNKWGAINNSTGFISLCMNTLFIYLKVILRHRRVVIIQKWK